MVWLRQGIAGDRRDRILEELDRITPGLGVGKLGEAQRVTVDFPAGDGPPVRIFVLVV